MGYKNIQVNESVQFMDDTLTSCYVVLLDVNIPSLKSMLAIYDICVYKTKEIFESHPEWNIRIDEIKNSIQVQFSPEFTQGDLLYKISNELKLKLLAINPTWTASNLIIEE